MFILTSRLVFFGNFVIVLKVNTKKHLDELVKDRDSWKTNCIKIWKGVAPVLDLISPKLPEELFYVPGVGKRVPSGYASL